MSDLMVLLKKSQIQCHNQFEISDLKFKGQGYLYELLKIKTGK